MANQILDNGLATLEFSGRNLLSFIEDIPADKYTWQPFKGANHTLWVLGHLTWTMDAFLTGLGGKQSGMPASWPELFAWKTTPVDDPTKYPPLAEVREVFKRQREAFLGWFKSMDEAKLAEPLPQDYQMFAPNYGAMMGALAWHEGMHAGQITVIRKALGLAPHIA